MPRLSSRGVLRPTTETGFSHHQKFYLSAVLQLTGIDLLSYQNSLRYQRDTPGITRIFDPIRRKYFIATPEEIVRQLWIIYLTETRKINPKLIGTVIGPGGKMINRIIEETGAQIDIDDDGAVSVASDNPEGMQKAIDWIKALTLEPEIGQEYDGKVVRLMDFGAFVEIAPGKDGLVHISELENHRAFTSGDGHGRAQEPTGMCGLYLRFT